VAWLIAELYNGAPLGVQGSRIGAVPPQVTQEEFAWREWVLGEGRFKEHGPRNRLARDQTGAPARIPADWWERLEAFLARRYDSKEKPEKPSVARRVVTAAPLPTRRAKDDSRLSPHFRLAEFDCKDRTKVPRSAVPALRSLCEEVLEPLRERFGPCRITSGYRPAAYNRRIGGARFSQHVYELHPNSVAADLNFARGLPPEWAAAADSLLARGGVGRYPGFIHVDNRGTKARWSG
jgi:hypothetical protein